MHARTLDFGTVLKDRLRLLDQPHNRESTQGAIVRPGREGPTIPVQLRGGLQSPNKTVTPAGTTTICMAGGTMCIGNASDTMSTTLYRIFCLIKVLSFEGSSNSRHIGSHYTRLILKHGTVYMIRQTPILLYDM
jgi:hypothetical protein